MAATLMSKASEYFASLNPLTKKIGQDKENLQRRYGEEAWAKLTHDQQEDLLNKFFVDIGIAEKYESEADMEEERPECFPRLMIPSGEKICVDFDNDQGWTWRDEHSGPFSWMTRSQQDLAMYEDEDEGIEDDASDSNKNGGTSNKSTPVGTPKRPIRKANKSQSPRPDAKGSLAYKPEKSIWDSPFLAADRGLDSAYPSSHSSDQSKGSDESDHGDMINKFGMAAAFSNAVREAEESECRAVSVCSNDAQPDLSPPEKEEEQLKVVDQSKRKKSERSPDRSSSSATLDVQGYMASPSRDSISSSGSGRSTQNKKSSSKSGSSASSKDKRWKPSRTEKKPEAERALMSELSVSVGSSIGTEDVARGQVSPVFIEDPGESSSDFNVSVNSNAKFLFQDMKRERPTTAPPPPPCVPPPPPPCAPPPPPPCAPPPPPRADTSSLSADSGNFSTPSSGQVNFAMEEPANHGYEDCEELDDWKVDLFSSNKADASTQRLLDDPVTDTSQDSLLHNEADNSDAPKTGFDFLDNW